MNLNWLKKKGLNMLVLEDGDVGKTMTHNILIFTGFVGGHGGAIKASRTYKALQEQGENPILVTESSYVPKLNRFGLIPDIIIEKGSSSEDSHRRVKPVLDSVDYSTMISFGPRTFGPRHAVENDKKVVIVDGGLPPFLGQLNTDHEKDVYSQATLYALTCHFPWEMPTDVEEMYGGITTEVLSQPLDKRTEEHFKSLKSGDTNIVDDVRRKFGLNGRKSLFIQIGYSLFDERNFESNGGWLKRQEYDLAHEFIINLLETLQQTEEPPIVFLDASVSAKFERYISDKRIDVQVYSFLPADEMVTLSRAVDLNVSRCMRGVTQFQISATGGYDVVCPCPTDYMHEDISVTFAENLGLIRQFPFNMGELGSSLVEYVGSDHYHFSKERRMESWKQMNEKRNLIKRILEVHQS
ncbi:hypothetical protein HOL21_03585 [Candidatus Woesearchaeota archaeon]|nr:hypothetical protein [Candidatus Woesearchaeota archaeon]MBT5924254.1 hypothetical protein [Candidatus Woesearchaeota archaeon]MBT6367185.1 hypothetical protein [Candidatus Woesearchaeota archaeon]